MDCGCIVVSSRYAKRSRVPQGLAPSKCIQSIQHKVWLSVAAAVTLSIQDLKRHRPAYKEAFRRNVINEVQIFSHSKDAVACVTQMGQSEFTFLRNVPES